jgi:acetyltransferase
MYLESFGNPRRFTTIARSVTRRMPVIAVKSGRTAAGAAAAASHTGALAGGGDYAADALLQQCGVLRAGTIEDLFNMALAFNSQPLPRGRRVALLTDAGGPAIMATDALEAAGLELAKLSDATKKALAKDLSPDASVANPVDMLGHSAGEDYARSMKLLLADDAVDAVIALYVPPVMHDPVEVAHRIFDAAAGSEKTVLCVLMARDDVIRAVKDRGGPSLPVYEYPESAVHALAAMARYREMRDRDPGRVPEFSVDKAAAAAVFKKAAREGREHLTMDEARAALAAYGVRFAASRLVKDRADLAAACREVGFPLVMKIVSADIVHKTEIGGVVTGVQNAKEALVAFDAIQHRAASVRPAPRIDGILVQEMKAGAREMILGVTTDPSFGPLMMAGLGGIYVEVLHDVSFRVHPITDRDADEMIAGLRGAKLLQGVRGERPSHVPSYRDALLRVSALVADFHGIRELDVNPFMLGETEGESVAVDARIRIDPKAF